MPKNNSWQLTADDDLLLDLALKEDLQLPYCDITTETLFADSKREYAVKIISKNFEDIVICGILLINAVLAKFGAKSVLTTSFQDGDILPPGETLLTIEGEAKTLLMTERLILNLLRHLSGVATLSKKFCDLVSHTSLKILDTRKTTPGLRHLEKYAVACGGGVNHRMGLYDAFMVKDTHIDLIGGLQEALAKLLPLKQHDLPVIVEIRDIEELKTVIKHGEGKVTRVLLDNMTASTLKRCVLLCASLFETEASGNINLSNITEIAETGVDYASVGMLTYAAETVDLSMQAI